jgi:hypothetical protein
MHRQSDRVARSAVDLDQFPVGCLHSQHGIVRVIGHAGDDDVLQLRSQIRDDTFQQIVCQRPWRWWGGQSPIDAGRFENPDQNRKRTFAINLAQVNDLLIIDFADDNPRQLHFDEHGGFFPAQKDCFAGNRAGCSPALAA